MSWKWTANFSTGTTAITASSMGTTVPVTKEEKENRKDEPKGKENYILFVFDGKIKLHSSGKSSAFYMILVKRSA